MKYKFTSRFGNYRSDYVVHKRQFKAARISSERANENFTTGTSDYTVNLGRKSVMVIQKTATGSALHAFVSAQYTTVC